METNEVRMIDIRTSSMEEPVQVDWQSRRGFLYINVGGICVLRVKVQHKDQVTIEQE